MGRLEWAADAPDRAEEPLTAVKRLMLAEAKLKGILKPLLFRGGRKPTRIRRGPARGVHMMLDRRSDLQREFGLHEMEVHSVYRRFIATDAVVFDVGAFDGDTALMFAALAPAGRVVAFEASAINCQQLGENLALNPELRNRVSLLHLFIGPGGEKKGNQRAAALDDVVSGGEAPAPTFVKIDVDGGEEDVLLGMSSLLAGARPFVLVETHSAEFEHCCATILRSAQYDVTIVPNARWRKVYPELRPIEHNRWLLGRPSEN